MAITIYPDRAAWLASRTGPDFPIGASEVAVALGLSRYATPFDLWRRHRDPRWRPDTGAQLDDGQRWEPLALRLHDPPQRTRLYVEPLAVASHGCGWLRATPDAWILPDGGTAQAPAGLVEIKTDRNDGASEAWPADGTEVREFSDADGCPVPPDYWMQVQAQIACTGAAWCDLVVWIPAFKAMPERRTIRVYPSKRWPAILAALSVWRERHLVGGEPPDPTSPEEMEALARWRYPAPAIKREATDEEAALIRTWIEARAERDSLDGLISQTRGAFAALRGDAQRIFAPGIGVWSISNNGAQSVKALEK